MKDIEEKTADQIINEISEILRQTDGDFIEQIANLVLMRSVTYIGDSIFQQAK